MNNWKRILLKSVGVGAGITIALVTITCIFYWQQTRPKPPKPWDAKSIVATFDYPDTEAWDQADAANPTQAIVLNYTLENTSEYDYREPAKDQVEIDAILRREKSLANPTTILAGDDEIFIPAKQRRRFALHLHYPMQEPIEGDPSTKEGQRKRWKQIAEFMKKNLTNVNGFALFDHVNRVEIVFPNGWDSIDLR